MQVTLIMSAAAALPHCPVRGVVAWSCLESCAVCLRPCAWRCESVCVVTGIVESLRLLVGTRSEDKHMWCLWRAQSRHHLEVLLSEGAGYYQLWSRENLLLVYVSLLLLIWGVWIWHLLSCSTKKKALDSITADQQCQVNQT